MENKIVLQKEYNSDNYYALDNNALVPGQMRSIIVRDTEGVKKYSFYKDREGIVYKCMQLMERI